MKRKIIALALACITFTLPACDLPGGGKTPENISSEEDAEEEAEEDNSGKKTDKSEWATINDEDIKDNKTKKENEDMRRRDGSSVSIIISFRLGPFLLSRLYCLLQKENEVHSFIINEIKDLTSFIAIHFTHFTFIVNLYDLP